MTGEAVTANGKTDKRIVLAYTLGGAAFGFSFPLIGWIIDIELAGVSLSPVGLWEIHAGNPIHWIIDSAPIVLGVVFRQLGWRQARIEAQNANLRLANDELQERNTQLLEARSKAATDGLTGIFNHRTFQERLRAEVEQTRVERGSIGLIMLDIDGFKQVNDTLGHLEGDKILQEVVGAIVSVAGSDATYRYGGDEFAVLLRDAEPPFVAATAEAIRRRVAMRVRDRSAVTISLGWSSYPADAATAEEMIYSADSAMYRAKGAGKNRVAHWPGRGASSAEAVEIAARR